MRYTWEFEDLYILTNPLYPIFNANVISDTYNGIKKINTVESYSSDNVDRISKESLKTMIKDFIS